MAAVCWLLRPLRPCRDAGPTISGGLRPWRTSDRGEPTVIREGPGVATWWSCRRAKEAVGRPGEPLQGLDPGVAASPYVQVWVASGGPHTGYGLHHTASVNARQSERAQVEKTACKAAVLGRIFTLLSASASLALPTRSTQRSSTMPKTEAHLYNVRGLNAVQCASDMRQCAYGRRSCRPTEENQDGQHDRRHRTQPLRQQR